MEQKIKRHSKKNRFVNNESKELKTFQRSIGSKPFGQFNVARFPGVGFPDQLRCTLRYSDAGVQFTGSIQPAAQVYRANSLFDPDLTGSGTQPEYFDQLSAVYSQYCVMGARIRAEIFNTGTVANLCALLYSDANIATQTTENMCEHRFAKHCIVSAKGGKDNAYLNLPAILNSTLQGEEHLNTDPSNYTGVGTNPTDPTYAIFRCVSMDNATNSNIYANFHIEYDCYFKELTPVTESKKKRTGNASPLRKR
jgi:hypothetical protein